MRTRRAAAALAFLLALGARAAMALEYDCPTDPGFCYADLGDDGCYDPDASPEGDVGPVNEVLEAGRVPRADASIICPPSVRRLVLRSPTRWRTDDGHDVVMHAASITAPNVAPREGRFPAQNEIAIEAGRNLNLGGDVVLPRDVRIVLYGGTRAVIAGNVISRGSEGRVEVDSDQLGIEVLAGVTLRGGDVALITLKGGRVVLGSGVRIIQARRTGDQPYARILASDGIEWTDLEVRGHGEIFLMTFVGGIVGHGHTKLRSAAPAQPVLLQGGDGDVILERVTIRTPDVVGMGGDGRLEIGTDGGSGVGASAIRAGGLRPDTFGPAGVALWGGQSIRLVRVLAQNEAISVRTEGALLAVRDSALGRRGPGAGEVSVVGGPTSTCDVAGTSFPNAAVTYDCATVVGP